MDESTAEQIAVAKILVAETRAQIATLKEGIERDKKFVEEEKAKLKQQLERLRNLKVHKPFSSE